MRSKRSREGYLYISPGEGPTLSLEEAAKTGKDIAGAGRRGLFESATVRCSHCHSIVVLNPERSRPRNWCSKCDSYICDSPGCNAGCLPMDKVFDFVSNTLRNDAPRQRVPVEVLRKIILG